MGKALSPGRRSLQAARPSDTWRGKWALSSGLKSALSREISSPCACIYHSTGNCFLPPSCELENSGKPQLSHRALPARPSKRLTWWQHQGKELKKLFWLHNICKHLLQSVLSVLSLTVKGLTPRFFIRIQHLAQFRTQLHWKAFGNNCLWINPTSKTRSESTKTGFQCWAAACFCPNM